MDGPQLIFLVGVCLRHASANGLLQVCVTKPLAESVSDIRYVSGFINRSPGHPAI
jgi:hypothetical protein